MRGRDLNRRRELKRITLLDSLDKYGWSDGPFGCLVRGDVNVAAEYLMAIVGDVNTIKEFKGHPRFEQVYGSNNAIVWWLIGRLVGVDGRHSVGVRLV